MTGRSPASSHPRPVSTPALDDAGLRAKVESFSRRWGPSAADETVVVVPLGGDLAKGFRTARERLRRGPVRLVGHGVTTRTAWPVWVEGARDLTLTELGAYRAHAASEPCEPIRIAVRRWIDDAFGELVPGLRASNVLFPAASNRIFTPVMDTRGLAEGIARMHPGRKIEVAGASWPDLVQLALPTAPVRRSRSSAVAWSVCFTAAWGAGLGATLARQARSFLDSARNRAELRAASGSCPPDAGRDVWVALAPDWPRLNRHVVEAVAIPMLRAGRLRGVLFADTLRDGLRIEPSLVTVPSAVPWPGLGPLREALPSIDIYQVVGAETLREHLVDTARSILVSARAYRRLVRHPTVQETDRVSHHLLPHAKAVAMVATIDVFRAMAAANAARRCAKRTSFRDTKVVFMSCSTPATGAACAVLNAAGACTIDFFHGAGIEHVHGAIESPAAVHATWTKLDAEAFESTGTAASPGGMSIRVAQRVRTPERGRVLIISNYAHRDESRSHSLPMLDELLRIGALAPPDFELRWRPHPSDSEQHIAAALGRARNLARSSSPSLADDVAWADYVVSSMSSAMIEALFADVPAFVHFPPHLRSLHAFSFVPAERSFFWAEELWPKLLDVHAGAVAGEEVCGPERAARVALFGTGDSHPAPLDIDLLAQRGFRKLG